MSPFQGALISGGVPLYIEVLYIEVLYIEVLSGVGIEEFHCIQRCPHFRVPSFQEEFHCIKRCFQGLE